MVRLAKYAAGALLVAAVSANRFAPRYETSAIEDECEETSTSTYAAQTSSSAAATYPIATPTYSAGGDDDDYCDEDDEGEGSYPTGPSGGKPSGSGVPYPSGSGYPSAGPTGGNGGSYPTGSYPAGGASSSATAPASYTTSTQYITHVYTVTSCAPTVTNCPVGQVTSTIETTVTGKSSLVLLRKRDVC